MDFASKGETDIYFFLKDNNFDENVAKLFEGKRRTDGNACSTRKVRRVTVSYNQSVFGQGGHIIVTS